MPWVDCFGYFAAWRVLLLSGGAVAPQVIVSNNFCRHFWLNLQNNKLCYSKCPLLLPTAICPLQGLFIMTLHFAKSQALAVFVYNSYGSWESWKSSGFGGDDDEDAELTVSSSPFVCLSKIFWSTICFIEWSSLRYSRRSRSFCDRPFALDVADEDELFSYLLSLLIGVNGACALSNKW